MQKHTQEQLMPRHRTDYFMLGAGGAAFSLSDDDEKRQFLFPKYTLGLATKERAFIKVNTLELARPENNVNDSTTTVKRWIKSFTHEKEMTQLYYADLTSDNSPVKGGIFREQDEGITTYESYLLMPWCDQSDLHSQIIKPVDIIEKENITKKVLNELVSLEKKEMVHNDIQPKNILFRGDCVHLSHFKNAHKKGKKGPVCTDMDTKKYAAPERLLKGTQRHSSYASDMYSMGLVLAEMYGVSVQYDSPRILVNQDGKKTKFTHFEPSVYQLIPSNEIIKLITAMTATDPNDRPTAQQALDRFNSASTISASTTSATIRFHRKPRLVLCSKKTD